MSYEITVSYNGAEIHSGSANDTVTLHTSGKLMASDVEVVLEQGADPVLDNNSWDIISQVGAKGRGANYWSIGDTKQVHLEGTMGTLSLNTDLWVYIIGFNHRNVNGITFQGFKTAASGGTDVCLVDSGYGSNYYSGSKNFNINHWGTNSGTYNTNYGGWKGCDLRYDILGSTSTAPSGYGSKATTSRVGYDASSTTATNPVNNTLMSCLPSDLRAVMQPMIVYTDNKGNSSNTSANVTTSVDYLPLLAEFEVFGARTYANTYEKNSQSQYSYYSAGNSKIKYKHSATSTAAHWWERSPGYSYAYTFCYVYTGGTSGGNSSRSSLGIAPMFLVGRDDGDIIQFFINGQVFHAEKDMTWSAWASSEYNTSDHYYYTSVSTDTVCAGPSGAVASTPTASNPVSLSDTIERNQSYYHIRYDG